MAGSLALTQHRDESVNMNTDFGGDLSTANRNIVAGGAVNIQGVTEDLAKQVFGAIQDAYTGATNFVQQAIGQADNRTQAQVETVRESLKEAYNSEASTISNLKTYAFYAVIAFVAWAYLKK